MAFLFLLVILTVIAFRLTTGEDRKQLLRKALVVLRELAVIAREEYGRLEPFRAALRARMKYAIATPVLVALNVVVFVFMLFGAGAFSDPSTLVSWGANFGPRTTNGEWWRVLTSTFVHVGFMRMVVEAAALAQLGVVLERQVGRSAFAAVFCLAGALAGLVNVSVGPMAVTFGTSGAIFGLYGLLLASIVHRDRGREEGDPQTVAIPVPALWWFIPTALLFAVSASSNDGFAFKANMAGLLVGLVGGAVLTYGILSHPPDLRRVLTTAGVTAAAIVAYAVPLRGIADVRPDIARIIALEDRTAGVYQTALERLRKGALNAEGLAQLIERTIVPELEAADAHLRSIRGVPPEHKPLVADADEYLRLRSASWRFYAEGWRSAVRAPRREADGVLVSDASWRQAKAQFRANAATRGKAEGSERASLEALQRIKSAGKPGAD